MERHYVFSSGDLVEDLTHNFFLERRYGKLKVSRWWITQPHGPSLATCSFVAAFTRSRRREP